MKCKCCGAELTGDKCEYCGSSIIETKQLFRSNAQKDDDSKMHHIEMIEITSLDDPKPRYIRAW